MDDDGRVVAPARSSCELGAGDAAEASSARAASTADDAPVSPVRALSPRAGAGGRGAAASSSASSALVRARPRARSPTECPELPRTHALADGELSPLEEARARAHAAGCAACRRELAFLRLLARAVARGVVIAGRS